MALSEGDLDYWARAAGEGDVVAMRHLARVLKDSDRQGSLRWMRRAAEVGDSDDWYRLGFALADENPVEAARWYMRAAEGGTVGAMHNLARLLRRTNRRESRRWLEEAAQRGHVNSMVVLANPSVRHPEGNLYWRRMAADNGHVGSMIFLASRAGLRRRVSFGSKRRQLQDERLRYLLRAAELNSAEAMFTLGMDYRGRDEAQARRWLQSAADQGHAVATQVLQEGLTGRNFLPLMRTFWRETMGQRRM